MARGSRKVLVADERMVASLQPQSHTILCTALEAAPEDSRKRKRNVRTGGFQSTGPSVLNKQCSFALNRLFAERFTSRANKLNNT